MAESLEDSEVPTVEDANVLSHPLRRHMAGPTDIEWALFGQKVANMKEALDDLIREVKKSNELALQRCASCNTSKLVDDHERRIRDVEKMVWKAMGLAAAIAGLTSFALDRIFNK